MTLPIPNVIKEKCPTITIPTVKITAKIAEEAYCKSAEADEVAYIAEKIAIKLEDSIIQNKTNKN